MKEKMLDVLDENVEFDLKINFNKEEIFYTL